jgi:hypothetical protein
MREATETKSSEIHSIQAVEGTIQRQRIEVELYNIVALRKAHREENGMYAAGANEATHVSTLRSIFRQIELCGKLLMAVGRQHHARKCGEKRFMQSHSKCTRSWTALA